jgi:hypothetical protein
MTIVMASGVQQRAEHGIETGTETPTPTCEGVVFDRDVFAARKLPRLTQIDPYSSGRCFVEAGTLGIRETLRPTILRYVSESEDLWRSWQHMRRISGPREITLLCCEAYNYDLMSTGAFEQPC